MNLSRYIQSPDLLRSIPGKTPEELQHIIINKGNKWFSENQEALAIIKTNCTRLGLLCSDEFLNRFQKQVLLHYYEKLLPLCGDPLFFKTFLAAHVTTETTADTIRSSLQNGHGVLLALAHFGAVEFIVPALASQKLPLNVVLRFTTEQLSSMARERAAEMTKTGFGEVRFIEIGRPGTAAALDMAAVLRRKEILVSVFDEKTEYSQKVKLFNEEVYGGAGLHRILKFCNAPVDIYTAYMIRLNDMDTTLKLFEIDPPGEVIQQFYAHLETMTSKHPEQWYFLHEEIPFVKKVKTRNNGLMK